MEGLEGQDRMGPKRCVDFFPTVRNLLVHILPSFGNLCPSSAPAFAMGTSATGLKGPVRSNIWLFQALDSCIINAWTNYDSASTLWKSCVLYSLRLLTTDHIHQ